MHIRKLFLLAAMLCSVCSLNTHRYEEAYQRLPQNLVLGSETSSTVSSLGLYKFPAERKADAKYEDHQSSSYDLEYCSWSNIPDIDFALADDHQWTLGQFVWIGFDYLGEPSPYDTDAWPNHSSMFGIIDFLCQRTSTIYTSAYGTSKLKHFIFSLIGTEKSEKEKKQVHLNTSHSQRPEIRKNTNMPRSISAARHISYFIYQG